MKSLNKQKGSFEVFIGFIIMMIVAVGFTTLLTGCDRKPTQSEINEQKIYRNMLPTEIDIINSINKRKHQTTVQYVSFDDYVSLKRKLLSKSSTSLEPFCDHITEIENDESLMNTGSQLTISSIIKKRSGTWDNHCAPMTLEEARLILGETKEQFYGKSNKVVESIYPSKNYITKEQHEYIRSNVKDCKVAAHFVTNKLGSGMELTQEDFKELKKFFNQCENYKTLKALQEF